MRQVVLDTETTGLSTGQGHRIIEIGCLELVNRRLTGREFHCFLNPDRNIDEGAERIHGISREDLETEPRFAEIVDDFLEFVAGAELIIHNASFDVGFINNELQLMQHPQPQIEDHAQVLDTLVLARQLHPGQRNSLDALCKRYEIDATRRNVHGALIDSELLAHVYLAMTGGQADLSLDDTSAGARPGARTEDRRAPGTAPASPDLQLLVIKASPEEAAEHDAMLEKIRKSGACVWDID
ncbi:MAG: DNA polymerase III subunit epsilon [Proteobacteria bacterium]|nr:DNA polymerase III subunit epsilon [Pseudomonadota bacterium]